MAFAEPGMAVVLDTAVQDMAAQDTVVQDTAAPETVGPARADMADFRTPDIPPSAVASLVGTVSVLAK